MLLPIDITEPEPVSPFQMQPGTEEALEGVNGPVDLMVKDDRVASAPH